MNTAAGTAYIRSRLASITTEWEEWAKGADGCGDEREEIDPLAGHLHPVPLL